MNIKYLDELERFLREYGISRDDVCLTGSEILAVENIRCNHDLDVSISPKALKALRGKFPSGYRWRINLSDKIELYRNHLYFIGISDVDIFCNELFIYHEGFKVAPIEIIYLLKKTINREKDINDLTQIIEHFPNIAKMAEKYRQSKLKIWWMRLRNKLQI